MVFEKKCIAKYSALVGFLLMMTLFSFPSGRALNPETISRRDLVIDLGDGLTTDAQLTFPAVGDGPFPGVLIIHGSGSTDMDGYIPAELTGTGEPVRHYLLMAEYLTERGFAVLRYNKRGIGLTGVTLDADIVVNKTVQDLIQDAKKALEVLMQQSQVDPDDITIIGRSEGAVIAPVVAIENPKVKNVVLMGAGAHNLYDISWYQVVERNMVMFDAIDSDSDGLTSVQEVQVLHPTLVNAMVENSTGEWLWRAGFDLDGDGFLNATGELRPRYVMYFEYLNQTQFQGSWYQSHFALDGTLEVIGDVPASVLILHGEGDQQGPVSEAFLLEQRLTEVGHPDHTLITYPGLGHTYYPVDRWLQLFGPPEDYVLSDLVTWLKDPGRNIRVLEVQLETTTNSTEGLQSQLYDEQTKINMLGDKVSGLEGENVDLRNALSFSKNLNYVSINIAVIAVVIAVLAYRARARRSMQPHRSDFFKCLFVFVIFSCSTLAPLVFGDPPDPRMGSGMVYDAVNERCVLMGGAQDTGRGWYPFKDMWAFDGTSGTWSELDVSGVPGRSNFQMAYSGDHGVIVAFSNDDEDTWVYDLTGDRWSRLRIGGPRRRGDAAFCYDPVNGVFIMFGGMTDGSASEQILSDTWAFDPDSNTWREMTPENSPPRCYGCRLVYDSVNEKLLLWGGNIPSTTGELNAHASKLDDWWSYDYPSNTWTRIETEDGPEGRYWHHMSFDPGVGKVVMFGGIPSGMSFGDTWLYDYALNQWTDVEPPVSPANRFCGAMVYDESIERVVLFGGLVDDQEEAGDTWLFDAEAGEWSIMEATAPTAMEEEEETSSEISGFPAASILFGVLLFLALANSQTHARKKIY